MCLRNNLSQLRSNLVKQIRENFVVIHFCKLLTECKKLTTKLTSEGTFVQPDSIDTFFFNLSAFLVNCIVCKTTILY